MSFQSLSKYLQTTMRMSHVYQPVMIKRLLLGKGKASDLEIAFDLIRMDESQLDYYKERVNLMVGKVLRKNGIVDKEKETYYLNGFNLLKQQQIEELLKICEAKIEAYQQKRGESIWQHRSKNRAVVSGSIRYEVLKRAHGRCELCGIRMEDRALEVDHIVPKNHGGEDSIHNYQALCYKCNSNKGDRDDQDFRGQSMVYEDKEEYCLFCTISEKRIVDENPLAYVVEDKYPVTRYHRLVIPKRHFPEYFSIKQPELNAVQQLLQHSKDEILKKDNSVSGFNIGINQGETAGQTIQHCHIHLIPRRSGDMENPRGGVRHAVAGKGYY